MPLPQAQSNTHPSGGRTFATIPARSSPLAMAWPADDLRWHGKNPDPWEPWRLERVPPNPSEETSDGLNSRCTWPPQRDDVRACQQGFKRNTCFETLQRLLLGQDADDTNHWQSVSLWMRSTATMEEPPVVVTSSTMTTFPPPRATNLQCRAGCLFSVPSALWGFSDHEAAEVFF